MMPAFDMQYMECRFRGSLPYYGLSGVLRTPPQTHQPVLGDGQGAGAYSKSKLLRLVRYCDEVEQAAASSARSFVTLKVIDLSSARIRTRRSGALSAAARATALASERAEDERRRAETCVAAALAVRSLTGGAAVCMCYTYAAARRREGRKPMTQV